MEGDTIDIFSYQIPEFYDGSIPSPILVAFHQWGGNENSTYYTAFDEEANDRGWIFMSPYGGSGNNYNHQGAQTMVKNEIIWMMDNYNIDSNRIYMVGGSMGGAAGMIYANNHLNPNEPMVAATASGSGILDCERRAIEMDGNNSMIEWFGGNWDEVPFEYHRNSAIYFNDLDQSMHTNLQYTPLYFDFGVSEPHRIHAEEMYEIMLEYNNHMWIDTDPAGSHGFSVMDEAHICEWLSGFSLETNPMDINLKLDQPSKTYWVEIVNQVDSLHFISIEATKDQDSLVIYNFENSDSLILNILNQNIENYQINSIISINKLGLSGDLINNLQIGDFYFQMISDSGLELEYTIDNNIIWLEHYGLPPYELPYYGNFTLNFQVNELINGDVNQDGTSDILDIILMVNHVIGTTLLTDLEFQIADMNNDSSIDVMDIILLVNTIIN
jgi:pimeloyl-ACP methyl ester carboxylesterase